MLTLESYMSRSLTLDYHKQSQGGGSYRSKYTSPSELTKFIYPTYKVHQSIEYRPHSHHI